MSAVRLAVTALVVVVMGGAIVGVGTGSAPKGDPAPTGTALAASKQRIASGGAAVQRGREEFEEEHCDACHAIAATGAKGKLGPRLDTQDEAAAEIRANIADPRADIAEGYEAHLMPTDYATRMSAREIDDVVAFIKAASGGQEGEDDEG